MSLLTICQNVITELGFGASPASVIGNNDALTAQCLALARRAVKDIQARQQNDHNRGKILQCQKRRFMDSDIHKLTQLCQKLIPTHIHCIGARVIGLKVK